MSQRSHMAQSGSSAIIACSAAWSVPSSRGIRSSSRSCSGSGRYQTASVSKVVAGRESVEVERGAVARGFLLVRDDLLGDGDPAEGQLQPETQLGAERLLDRSR